MPEIEIDYFTDPLCCWSWAMEPALRRLRYESGGAIACRSWMGGLLADWRSFSDPLNSVHRPAQMGPHWFYVRSTTSMPIDERVWMEDPPESSYPACLAVKAAALQGAAAGEAYLRASREAVMLRRRNVAAPEVLLSVAQEVAEMPAFAGRFDSARFERDLEGDEARVAFRDDLKETRFREIGRFPSLILTGRGGPGLLITGYRPVEALREAVAHLAPDLATVRVIDSPVEYAAFWGSITAREVADACGQTLEETARDLDEAVAGGLLAAIPGSAPGCTTYRSLAAQAPGSGS